MKKRFENIVIVLFVVLYFSLLYHVFNDTSRVLYSYAFSFSIAFFFFHVGILYAVRKLVLDYQVQGYFHLKRKSLYLSYGLAAVLYGIFFFLLFLVEPVLFWNIKWEKDFLVAIQFIGVSSCIQPFLSTLRGYFYGHHLENYRLRSGKRDTFR